MKALIVEDDVFLARALTRLLTDWGASVHGATSLKSGLEALQAGPELIIVDVCLPDGSGIDIAERATQLRPVPLTVALSGQATAADGFRLARLGVIGFLPKPVQQGEFIATLEALLERVPDIAPTLVASVGREPFQDLLARVRKTMVEQALALAHGNRTVAARLLGVTRQAVQQQIRDHDISS